MKRILSILICLCMASAASALTVTNGDFENQTGVLVADIVDWYDYGGPLLDQDKGPFFIGQVALSITNTKIAAMGVGANAGVDGGNHAYAYQSLGIYDGSPVVLDVELDWGMAPQLAGGKIGTAGVTVMILESDGRFEPNEWDGDGHDIYGFRKTETDPNAPITVIGLGTVTKSLIPDQVHHELFQIDLSDATIGNELFLRFNNIKGNVNPYVQIDNIVISPADVFNKAPENGTIFVSTALDSPENDLVFEIVDEDVGAIDVLFGPENDPNLSSNPAYKIINKMAVTPGEYTITLEDLSVDLLYDREYSWKVLAYEADGVTLKYTGLTTSFKTIQKGPLLEDVTPDLQGVWPGDEAVFKLSFYNKTETFQWFKEAEPEDVALTNGAKYAGVDSNSLTIYDCQTADEGVYYCKGWYTEPGPEVVEAQSASRGELAIKELKSYYPFDSTGSDAQGTYTPDIIGGKNAYLMGGASLANTDPIGSHGSYLALDNPRGVTHEQYAEILDDTVAHHKEITISCWVKPALLDLDYERYARIFDFGQGTDDYFYLTLLQGSNRARCMLSFKDDEGKVDVNKAEGTGDIGYGTKWIYVVLTINQGRTGKIYINGKHGGEDGLYHPSDIAKPLNYLGKAIATPDTGVYPNFNGLIDELMIYNYPKTADQIAQDYMDVRTDVEFICNRDDYNLRAWDYDDSCEVDLGDLAEIAERWLVNYFIDAD